MQQGHNGKKFNNSCYISRSACNFLCSATPAALFFSHSLSPLSSNCPVRTDISIAQKTCVFRPVDISVAALKRNKLIYQSVYSLLGTELPQSSLRDDRFPFLSPAVTSSPGRGKSSSEMGPLAWWEGLRLKCNVACEVTPSVIACGDATFPKGTAFGGGGKVSGIVQRRPLGGAVKPDRA